MLEDRYRILTGVGPGTATGALMRQYWIPIMRSSELAIDGDPVRLRVLGENLIAFRTGSGKVGVLDHRCPHRCASLFLGRNEHEGIRCVYHGWKFDVDGRCVDMPNVPPELNLKDRVTAIAAYPTQDRAGLVWVFMGKQKPTPPLPNFAASLLTEEDVSIRMMMRECNWLQALEGDIDTSHVGFLHMGLVNADDFASDDSSRRNLPFLNNRAPKLEVVETAWGVMGGAHAAGEGPEGHANWRIAQFAMPFWTMTPGGALDEHVLARAWVPIDDENTMFVSMSKKGSQRSSMRSAKGGKALAGVTSTSNEMREQGTGWLERWRLLADRNNDWNINRDQQRTQSYTGIETIHLQDQAVTESMGAIVDRSFEHLVASDRMVIAVRRRLLEAVATLAEKGEAPANALDPSLNALARGGKLTLDEGADWQDAYFATMNTLVAAG